MATRSRVIRSALDSVSISLIVIAVSLVIWKPENFHPHAVDDAIRAPVPPELSTVLIVGILAALAVKLDVVMTEGSDASAELRTSIHVDGDDVQEPDLAANVRLSLYVPVLSTWIVSPRTAAVRKGCKVVPAGTYQTAEPFTPMRKVLVAVAATPSVTFSVKT